MNAATSLCGLSNAIAVDISIESNIESMGIFRLADVSALNEEWVWSNYSGFNTNVLLELMPSHSDEMRDYAVMCGAFTFFEGNSPFRDTLLAGTPASAAIFGWGDAANGENIFVGDSSSHGDYTIASDFERNLAPLSSVVESNLHQITYSTPAFETNVRYVTFTWTDGDNLDEVVAGVPTKYQSTVRGSFPMRWVVPPTMADLAPAVLRWYYGNASNGDFFLAGPSGAGYLYPSMVPSPYLGSQIQTLTNFMVRANLSIAQLIDFNSFGRMDLWNRYLTQPVIAGLFYNEYASYNAYHGQIEFSTNGKPIIATREMLWPGLPGCDLASVTNQINNSSTDVTSPRRVPFGDHKLRL